jgi:hypothetical protein
MIIVRLMGGLGNQLFQYALGRSFEAKDKKVLFERSILDSCSARTYLLDDFRTSVRFTDKIIDPEIVERSMPYDPDVLWMDDCTLTGYWQCEKYFLNIKRELRNELIPIGISDKSIEIARQMGSNSVALHIRRSDSLSARAMPYHGLLTDRDYYSRAIKYIESRVPNCHYFVFSDDIPWCRENLKIDCTFVDHNPMSGVCDENGIIAKGFRGRECEDLWLMSQCQHAIIANSTFSWWAAWLGDGGWDRIVIAPKQWFVSADRDARDIVPLRWMTL